jgi:hypothetical protein
MHKDATGLAAMFSANGGPAATGGTRSTNAQSRQADRARPRRLVDESATRQGNGLRQGSIPRFARWESMDKQSKREIWVLAISTVLVEVPVVAIAALAIAAH